MWRRMGYGVSHEGRLIIGGCDACDLAASFGTPLYVYDETALRATAQQFLDAARAHLPGGCVSFSSKAFPNMAVERLLHGMGFDIDVSSGGELEVALRAGVPASAIVMHGNNRSAQEIARAVEEGVRCLSIDALPDVAAIAAEAARQGKRQAVSVRVNPGVEGHTHEFIKTATVDSKFGVPLHGGEALACLRAALAQPSLQVVGINCHIGSQLLSFEGYDEAASRLVNLLCDLRRACGVVLPVLDMGGGFAAWYEGGDAPPQPALGVERIARAVRAACEARGYPLPAVWLEPGRALVAEAGVALYRVGVVKRIAGVRNYVAVDGGIHDNPRPALYGARYTCALAGRMNEPAEGAFTVVGKNCESSDVFVRDARLPSPRAGDVLAVFSSGAYQLAMASNYNRFCKPAAVLVKDGRAALVQAREDIDHLLALERMPDWL